MTIQDWAALTATIATLGGIFSIGVRWTIKHYLAELKPNGGSSIKDHVNALSTKVDKLEIRVDEIYSLLLNKKD
jgi:hypothetical protein